jgi:SRSO17 transposase
VWTAKHPAVVAGVRVGPAAWRSGVDELLDRIAGRFGRVECRGRVRGFLLALLADLPRKNCWTIAEQAGDATPDGMQHLLGRARWDTDGVAEDLRDYVVEHLGEPGAVLVIDETGNVKKGRGTVGVQRQYTGTAGRIENSQVAVYLTYAARGGHALIDRELYLPRSWTDDPARCAAAGVPAEVGFATKPALATAMLTGALDAGVPAAWVAGDEVYGADPDLRAELEARGVGYVLAIAGNRRLPTPAGPLRADVLAAALPARAWQRLSAGPGGEGAAVLRLGLARAARSGSTRRRRGRYRVLLAADPPLPAHRRAGLLPLLSPHPGAADPAGRRRRAAVDGGGVLPGEQGPGRPR